MTASLSVAAGATFGPYRILAPLGAGGMGAVYHAEVAASGEAVALKTLDLHRGVPLELIRREIIALSAVEHPGIIRIIGAGLDERPPWYAMRLERGSTLDVYLRRCGLRAEPTVDAAAVGPTAVRSDVTTEPGSDRTTPVVISPSLSAFLAEQALASAAPVVRAGEAPALPVVTPAALEALITVMRRLCSPLAYLHGEGIVHCDLKPANVLVRPDGAPVLLDFDIAARFAGPRGREQLGPVARMAGTVGYMAPEQIRGEVVDARTDLYGLGCVIYELLTGRWPFVGTPMEVLWQHCETAPRPPSHHCQGVPAPLEELVLRLLEKSPRDRLGHADDVARVLGELGGEDLPAWRGLRAREYLYRTGFTGREEVLGQLLDRFLRSLDDGAQVALLSGESGVGKTRTVVELAKRAKANLRAQRLALEVVLGECTASAGTSAEAARVSGAALHPFRPFLQLVADECRTGGAAITARLLGANGRALQPHEPGLGTLPGWDALPELEAVTPRAAHERVLRALAEVVRAYAEEHALLLVVDDLQWADQLTLDFLELAAGGGLGQSRVLLLGTYRVEEVTAELERVGRSPRVDSLGLQRLDEPAVGQLVQDMLGLPQPLAQLASFLAGRSEGNPFFVAEYLRAAVSEGLLRRDARGRWQIPGGRDDASAYARLPLPGSLAELLDRRLGQLSTTAREMLELCAVIGREIEAGLLGQLSGLLPAEGDAAVRELLVRQILEDSSSGRLRFVHDKLRETAYEGLSGPRRQELHGRVAAGLEEHYRGHEDLPLQLARLALHFTRAGQLEPAVEYLERAAEQALRSFANRDALALLKELWRLGEELAGGAGPDDAALSPPTRLRRARWQRLLADAHFGLGEIEPTLEHARLALTWAGHAAPTTPAGWAMAVLKQVPRQVAHRLWPGRLLARDQGQRQIIREAALAMQRISMRSYFYDALAMVGGSLTAVNFAESSGGPVQVVVPYAMLALTLGVSRMGGLARRYFDLAQRAASATDDHLGRLSSLYIEGVWLSGDGRWAEATRCLEAALALAPKVADRTETNTARTILANAEHFTGRYDQACERLREVIRVGREDGNQQQIAWGLFGLARSLDPLGQPDEALRLCQEAHQVLESQADQPSKIIVCGLLSRLERRAGRLDAALSWADRTALHIRDNRLVAYAIVTGYADALETYVRAAAGDVKSPAGRAARSLARDLSTLSLMLPIARPYLHGLQARSSADRGDRRSARRQAERAVSWASQLSMPYEEACTRLQLADLEEPAAAELHRTRAQEILSRLSVNLPR
jgi:serine/threonine protein kinase/tetratricopeptide (TPR) repeat protein